MMMIRRSCCPPSATYEVPPRFRLTSLMTGGRWLLQVFTGYGYTDPDVKLMAHAAWSWEEPRYDFDMQVAITNPSSTQVRTHPAQVSIHYAQVRIHPAVTYTSQSCSGAQAYTYMVVSHFCTRHLTDVYISGLLTVCRDPRHPVV